MSDLDCGPVLDSNGSPSSATLDFFQHRFVVVAYEHGTAGEWFFRTEEDAQSFIDNTIGSLKGLFQSVSIETREEWES